MGYNIIKKDEKWRYLVQQIKATITEAVHNSRWILVEGYWNIGKLIREELPQKEITKALQGLAVEVGVSSRTLWYCIQCYDKYPSLGEVPEGKNITWNKLVTKYLPIKDVNPDGDDPVSSCPHRQVEILIRCARCRERLAFRRQGRDSVVDLAKLMKGEKK